MSIISTPVMPLLERYLDLTSNRTTLVTSNLANVDTPGYRTKDIDFASEMRRAMDGSDNSTTPMVQDVSGLVERPDGNNVSLDRESLLLAETQMQYRLGVQFVRHEFQTLLQAIKEGNTGQ
jgi:flagellar basal-body rod protein FlgB